MKRGKKGQAANEAAAIITFMTFFLIVTLAAISDDFISASDNNYRNLLTDIADVIEQEAQIAFSSENGYSHPFTLPPTLNGQPYSVSMMNSTETGSPGNTTMLFVSSQRSAIPLNISRLLAGGIQGNIAIGQNKVRKENGVVILTSIAFPPDILTVNPSGGSTGGGTSVTITGSDFTPTPSVSFGGAAAAGVTYINFYLLQAVTPAHAEGSVGVTVTNPDGQSDTLAGGFTYALPPAISTVSPRIGLPSGETSVTIIGSGFVASSSVTFGGVAATNVVFVNGNTLTATTPAHAVGFVDVKVTNPDGQSATKGNGFLYRVEPVPVGTVFLLNTGQYYNGNLGGLAGADALCQNVADSGSFGGVWKAWLSTSTVNAKDRMPDATYRRLDDMVIANSKADLTDGSLTNSISLTDTGLLWNTWAWTGTNLDGTYNLNGDCGGWASTSGSAEIGNSTSVTQTWTVLRSQVCGGVATLYCFKTAKANGESCSGDSECQSSICGSDADNDSYFSQAAGHTGTCQALSKPYTDCYDSNANTFPGQTAYFSVNRGDGSFDYDCDGQQAKQHDCVSTLPEASSKCYTTRPTGTEGYQAPIPACGASGTWVRCSSHYGATGCTGGVFFSPQSCSNTCSPAFGNTGWEVNGLNGIAQPCK